MKRIIAVIFFFYACGSSQNENIVHYSEPIIYSSEDACKIAVGMGRKRIDSFIMLRCATTDTVTWKRYEDSVQKEIARILSEIGKGNAHKYLNTHSYKKIPCIIGDSVMLFYKQ